MVLTVLVCSLVLVSAVGQQADDDWVDPYDMLHYDSTSKTMRKPTEPAHYDNVATKRREYTEDTSQAELGKCSSQVADLQKKIEEQKKEISLLSEQSSCNPVFRRFPRRLMKEMQRLGLPTDSSDAFYDARVGVSKQAITEIQALLDGEDNWRTGAPDVAVSQILVNLKPHDYDAWRWRFEDTFGVELYTLIKTSCSSSESDKASASSPEPPRSTTPDLPAPPATPSKPQAFGTVESPVPRPKRKRDQQDDLAKQMASLEDRGPEIQQQLHGGDDCSRFGQTVADLLRRVPDDRRSDVMLSVYSLIHDNRQ